MQSGLAFARSGQNRPSRHSEYDGWATLRTMMDQRGYCFTSKRLADDQLPGVPEAELARTRHHILIVGSVFVVYCEAVVF